MSVLMLPFIQLTPEGVGAEMGASGSLESEMAGSPSQNIPFSFAKVNF